MSLGSKYYRHTESVPLTPQLAVKFSTMDGFKGERPLKEVRLKFLQQKVNGGLFYSPRWAVAKIGDKTVRVNGQHSSTVLAASNGDFPRGLTAIIDHFEVSNEGELAELFDQFDDRRSVRNRTESINAYAMMHAELESVPKRALACAVSGIEWSVDPERKGRNSPPEGSRGIVNDWKEFIAWSSEYLIVRHIGVTPVAAVIFLSWRKSATASAEFWGLVSAETHPDARHPSRVLARYLRSSRGGGKSRTRENDRAVFVKCIHAWNAFRRGLSTDLKYHARAAIPPLV